MIVRHVDNGVSIQSLFYRMKKIADEQRANEERLDLISIFEKNRYVIVQHHELDANDVYQDFRKAIKLLKQGESGKAKEFLASCMPPEAKDLEGYLIEKGVV